MVLELKKTIAWRDGAILELKRLSKIEKEAIEKECSEKHKLDFDELKISEMAKAQIIEKERDLELSPPEKIDNIQKEIDALKVLSNYARMNLLSAIGNTVIERTICGWKGLVDENGNEIPFDTDTLSTVFNFIQRDKDSSHVIDSIVTFVKGPLGNSKAGLTVASNTNGTQPIADNASENVSK